MSRMSRMFYAADAKIYPEINLMKNEEEVRENDDYISSDSDEDEKETHICGIAINIGERGRLHEFDFQGLDDDDNEYKFSDNCYRSYSIACEKDDWNIHHGRCPDYAVDWDHEFNKKHWPIGHDYINGHEYSPTRQEYTGGRGTSFLENLFKD